MLNIKELRIKKGISQTELANQIGVTIRTIQHWEKGTKNITIDKLEKINSIFNLNMNIYSLPEKNDDIKIVNDEKSEYLTSNSKKIKELEEKMINKDKQLQNYKEQLAFIKKSIIEFENKN